MICGSSGIANWRSRRGHLDPAWARRCINRNSGFGSNLSGVGRARFKDRDLMGAAALRDYAPLPAARGDLLLRRDAPVPVFGADWLGSVRSMICLRW